MSFAQPWSVYEAGFGHPQGNYWAGLANIYHLTNSGTLSVCIMYLYFLAKLIFTDDVIVMNLCADSLLRLGKRCTEG